MVESPLDLTEIRIQKEENFELKEMLLNISTVIDDLIQSEKDYSYKGVNHDIIRHLGELSRKVKDRLSSWIAIRADRFLGHRQFSDGPELIKQRDDARVHIKRLLGVVSILRVSIDKKERQNERQ